MPNQSSKGHKDLNQTAFSAAQQATGEIPAPESTKNKAAQELGRLGGLKGGVARAAKLTPEQRSEIARKAAQKRWGTTTESTATEDEQERLQKKKRGVIPSPDF
jgi:hypothetical protein